MVGGIVFQHIILLLPKAKGPKHVRRRLAAVLKVIPTQGEISVREDDKFDQSYVDRVSYGRVSEY